MGGYALATHIVIQMPARRPLPSGMLSTFATSLPACRVCREPVIGYVMPGKQIGWHEATIGCNGCGKYGMVVRCSCRDPEEAKQRVLDAWKADQLIRATESPNG